ncbi:MAG: RNA polymerase sigma factor [Chitinophagales bacterium]|nr:RNA polymerase sigma factor [Chitinophagales bacterium]
MDKQNDEAIVLSVLKGNVTDFRHLVDRHSNLAYRTAFSVCQSHEDAQEITQDAFIKAFLSLASFQRKSKFSTWLFRIVYYTALNHLEKTKSYKKSVNLYGSEYDFDELADFTIPGQLTQREEQEKFVHEALTQLNPDDRLALSLFYMEEKQQKEISQLTGWSLSAVKVRIFRARNKLQEVLEKLLVNEKGILP